MLIAVVYEFGSEVGGSSTKGGPAFRTDGSSTGHTHTGRENWRVFVENGPTNGIYSCTTTTAKESGMRISDYSYQAQITRDQP